MKDVVITCPAYFGFEERNATRAAGELIGLNVLNIINEPTAAALSYCARQFQEERTIMVYDLGGGTFDVTVMKMSMVTNEAGEEVQKLDILATGGNDLLGGKDWDDILYGMLENVCCEENGISPEDLEPESKQAIRSKVETVKKKLTNAEKAKVNVDINGAMTKVEIQRADFENQAAGKVAQTMTYVEDVLAKAGNPSLDLVLLVGGSTFMPMVRKAVEGRFPDIPVNLHEPNLAVAKGAAIYANMLVAETQAGSYPNPNPEPDPNPEPGPNPGREGGLITVVPPTPPIDIKDKLPRSFGPGVLNENEEFVIDNLVKEGDECPAEVIKEYYIPADNMKMIRLRVFENQSQADSVVPCEDREGNTQYTDPADGVKKLGQLEMELPPGVSRGDEVVVTFHVDMSGIYVKTLHKNSGTEKDATITFQSNVDKEKSAVHGLMVEGE